MSFKTECKGFTMASCNKPVNYYVQFSKLNHNKLYFLVQNILLSYLIFFFSNNWLAVLSTSLKKRKQKIEVNLVKYLNNFDIVNDVCM